MTTRAHIKSRERQRRSFNPPDHAVLTNERALRRDLEALLATYPDVIGVWPEGRTSLFADLTNGQTLHIEYKFEQRSAI